MLPPWQIARQASFSALPENDVDDSMFAALMGEPSLVGWSDPSSARAALAPPHQPPSDATYESAVTDHSPPLVQTKITRKHVWPPDVAQSSALPPIPFKKLRVAPQLLAANAAPAQAPAQISAVLATWERLSRLEQEAISNPPQWARMQHPGAAIYFNRGGLNLLGLRRLGQAFPFISPKGQTILHANPQRGGESNEAWAKRLGLLSMTVADACAATGINTTALRNWPEFRHLSDEG